jgi:hypothetical protein
MRVWPLAYLAVGCILVLAISRSHRPYHAPVSTAEWLLGAMLWPVLLVGLAVMSLRRSRSRS